MPLHGKNYYLKYLGYFFKLEIMILKFMWKNKHASIDKDVLEEKKCEGKVLLSDMNLIINKSV